MERIVARRFAWRGALVGFVLTIANGLFSSVGFDATLRAALLSLAVMYGLGWISGALWSEAFEPAGQRIKSCG
jgi:hypothetical protein